VRADMLKAYVESLLERLIGATKVEADADGDYPVRYKNALYYVRVVGDGSPVVQVFSIAVEGVSATPDLFEELNTINSNIKFARVFWVRDQVLVERELVGEGVDPADFDNACEAVATITDHYGPLLAEKFGGKTAFADEKTAPVDGSAETPSNAQIGQYL
jgi:hypothetical protein